MTIKCENLMQKVLLSDIVFSLAQIQDMYDDKEVKQIWLHNNKYGDVELTVKFNDNSEKTIEVRTNDEYY